MREVFDSPRVPARTAKFRGIVGNAVVPIKITFATTQRDNFRSRGCSESFDTSLFSINICVNSDQSLILVDTGLQIMDDRIRDNRLTCLSLNQSPEYRVS